MKKLVLFLLFSILLVGCGANELNTFVEDYNQSARKYDTTELIENEFGDMEKASDLYEEMKDEDEEVAEIYKNSNEGWRNLYISKEYEIKALYDGDELTGYSINVDSETNSIDKTGKGYNAALTLADSLGLNTSDLEKGMQEAFNDDFYDYEDGDYEVRISVINVSSASMSITIENK